MSFSNKCLPSITESIMKFHYVTLGVFCFFFIMRLSFNNQKHNNPTK